MNVQNVKIGDIEIIENVRLNPKDFKLKEIMESIKQHGLLQAIGVCKSKSGKFIFKYGYRRLKACEALGYKTIPAVVYEESEMQELLLVNITENEQREAISPMELGRIADILITRHAMTPELISSRLSCSVSKIKTALEVYGKLPAAYRDKVKFMSKGATSKNGNIPASVAKKILTLKKSFKLNAGTVDKILNDTRMHELTLVDLDIISKLMAEGLSPDKALANAAKFKCFRIDVTVNLEDLEVLMKKEKIDNPISLFRHIIYGQSKPINKPDFINI